MLCSKCGKQNPDSYLYCMGCGSELFAITEEALTDWTVPAETEPKKVDKKSLPPVRKITFREAVKNFFKNYATFKGRATRREYWFAYLFTFLVALALVFFTEALGLLLFFFGVLSQDGIFTLIGVFNTLYLLFFLLPVYALIWRRLHDTGHSGAMFLLALIPIVNLIVYWWLFFASSDGDNKYGPRKVDAPSGISPDL